MILGMALSAETERLKFMIAHRPGLMSPTLFVQQVNTFSTLAPGRITLNLVAGHSPAEQLCYGDGASHDIRYERMAEYLEICRLFWTNKGPIDYEGRFYRIAQGCLRTPFVGMGRRAPEIYLGGGSAGAQAVAKAHADCWLRFADTPENVEQDAASMDESGKEMGLRLASIVRPSHEQAVEAAKALLASHGVERRRLSEARFVNGSDSESMRRTYEMAEREWLSSCLWGGAVRVWGATALALVGSPQEVAEEIMRLKEVGVSQFILHGWPKREEMRIFCREVLPLVRQFEQAARWTTGGSLLAT
jgi:alkanesulfonate monooxygenase